MSLVTDVTIGTKSSKDGQVIADCDGRYWQIPLPEGDERVAVHGRVIPFAKKLRDVWKPLADLDREHDAIYENRSLRTRGTDAALGVAALKSAGFVTSKLFVTTSIIDTMRNRFAKRRTMPQFVVDDAEWELKQKAQDYGRWLHGKLMDPKYDRLRPRLINDAMARGDGLVYVDESEEDVFAERVHRREVLIDPYEAEQGPDAVQTMYRHRPVSRDSLIARFPQHKAAILEAPEISEQDELTGDRYADKTKIGKRDVVWLVEAWHLPSGAVEDGEECDGRVAVCLENVTLYYGEWREPRFPIHRLTCFHPQEGYWGRGIVELLKADQLELNQMVADIGMNIRVTGKGIWLVPAASQVQPEQVSGYRPIFLSLPGAGMQPQFYHPPPVSPSTIQLIEKKIEWMHNHTGAAQWFSTGRSPLGAGASGAALDTQEDLYSDRHSDFEQSLGNFAVDVGQAYLDAARRWQRRWKDEPGEDEAPSEEPSEREYGEAETEEKPQKSKPKKRALVSTWMDKGSLCKLDFNECCLEEGAYRLQLEPSGFLPSTRSGKLALVAELIAKGVIPQDMASTLFDEPDIAHANRLILAMRRNVERIVEQAGNPSKPMPAVEEWHDLEMLLDYTKKYFNRAQAENAPEEAEIRLRELGDMVLLVKKQMAEKAAAEAPQPGAPPPGAGPMPPGMPPDAGMGAPLPIDPMAGAPMDPSMLPPIAA